MKSGVWTASEDALLRKLYPDHAGADLVRLLDRNAQSIRNRCWRLGIKGKGAAAYTDMELVTIRAAYAAAGGRALDLATLAASLGRPKASVAKQARLLGLTLRSRKRVEKVDGRWPSQVRKFATVEALRLSQSTRLKQQLQEHGHPRGALGMHHSAAVKAASADRARRMNASRTPEQREAYRQKTIATRIARYGTAGPIYVVRENAYSRAKRGRRADLGDIFFRSRWEANYARFLNWLKARGEIQDWAYEVETFVFSGVTRAPVNYTPDFRVIERTGEVVYHEVKGWMDGKSRSKLRRMEQFYPDVKVIVIAEPEYKTIAQWARLIDGWEDDR